MICIVSPTKTQKEFSISEVDQSGLFQAKKDGLLKILQTMTKDDLQAVFKVSSKIIDTTYNNFQKFQETGTALLTYQGLSFKNMNIAHWSANTLNYANEHLLILSALYGLVKPLQRIGLYRLDFNANMPLDLYDYWQYDITTYLNSLKQPIVNLASKEYSAMIDFQLCDVPIITLHFGTIEANTFNAKATYSKIARGRMIEYIMTHEVDTLEDLKAVRVDGYVYNDSHSDASNFYYTRIPMSE